MLWSQHLHKTVFKLPHASSRAGGAVRGCISHMKTQQTVVLAVHLQQKTCSYCLMLSRVQVVPCMAATWPPPKNGGLSALLAA